MFQWATTLFTKLTRSSMCGTIANNGAGNNIMSYQYIATLNR
jgi:hypothetical protein